jgi:hypothetical protein
MTISAARRNAEVHAMALMGRAPFLSPFRAIPMGCGAFSESALLYIKTMHIIQAGMKPCLP